MKLSIRTRLDYQFAQPADVLLQFEAAAIPEQSVDWSHTHVTGTDFARVPAQDGIGDRIWIRAEGRMAVEYDAHVTINRILRDARALPHMDPRELPGEAVQYLMPSRYCPADHFHTFVETEFDGLKGGALVMAMRDWIADNFTYVSGVSNSDTTALDSFVRRQGVCRDYAHVLITLARAAAIPARMASVYAPNVTPPDFHAVAEIFLAGEWHLIDATGMATEAEMAKIGVGRDAADVSFMTAYGFGACQNVVVSVQEMTA
jgi:transglutaminase-like putative cysteine protease